MNLPARSLSSRLRSVIALRLGLWVGGVLWMVVGMTGCTHVSPWKRGALADPVMQADRDPLGGMLTEHMWFSREAATGGRGVGGGGCGCN